MILHVKILKLWNLCWDYAYDKVGYLGTNTPIDKCYECGYEGDFDPTKKDLNVHHVVIQIQKLVMLLKEHVVI